MATPTIKSANAEQEASLAGVLTLAFMSDPVMRWLWPNPLDYLTNYPLMVRCFGETQASSTTAFTISRIGPAPRSGCHLEWKSTRREFWPCCSLPFHRKSSSKDWL